MEFLTYLDRNVFETFINIDRFIIVDYFEKDFVIEFSVSVFIYLRATTNHYG